SDFPDHLLYNNDFSWVKVDGDVATLGVIGPAAKKVKEFVFIQLPEKGKQIKKGETYVSLEAMKWSGHLSSPVTGEVVDVNDDLFDEPSVLNESPYEKWIAKIRMSNPDEKDKLMDSKKVEDWAKENVH
ncbi:MAG: glycine cleavage system protein H, partial [Nanoarchaeota archaeon]